MEKFSVLTCLYKNDKVEYVKEALDSILASTVKPSEIVLIIDGPVPDEMKNFLEDYAKTNKELKIHQNEENLGLGKTLNKGLLLCENEYVARMDSDDICVADRFEKQLKIMQEQDLDLLGGFMHEFCGTVDNIISTREVPKTMEEIKKFVKTRNPFNHITVMFKKSKVLEAGNYQDMHYVEDYFLWCRMILAGAKMASVEDVFALARVDEKMYQRRGGYKYFKSQKKLFDFMRKNKMLNLFQYLKTLAIRFCVQVLMPNKLRERVYNKQLRKK